MAESGILGLGLKILQCDSLVEAKMAESVILGFGLKTSKSYNKL